MQKTSVSISGIKEFCSFHYPGNGKFLVSTPAKNVNCSSLWMVDSTRSKKIFSDIVKKTQSIAFGCDQGNGSLVVVALKDQSVMVKDMKSGIERK